MADKKKGYIPLWRDIQDHWLWKSDEKFSKAQAWIDILLSVNHESRKILINGNLRTIKAGQWWTSQRKLSERWHWDKDTVKSFLMLLQSDGMIYHDPTGDGTLITLINYDNFSIRTDTHSDTKSDSESDTIGDTESDTDSPQTIIKKNYKNDKELKKIIPAPPNDGGEWQ